MIIGAGVAIASAFAPSWGLTTDEQRLGFVFGAVLIVLGVAVLVYERSGPRAVSELEAWIGERLAAAALIKRQRSVRSDRWYIEQTGAWHVENVNRMGGEDEPLAPDLVDDYYRGEAARTGIAPPHGMADHEHSFERRIAWLRDTLKRLRKARRVWSWIPQSRPRSDSSADAAPTRLERLLKTQMGDVLSTAVDSAEHSRDESRGTRGVDRRIALNEYRRRGAELDAAPPDEAVAREWSDAVVRFLSEVGWPFAVVERFQNAGTGTAANRLRPRADVLGALIARSDRSAVPDESAGELRGDGDVGVEPDAGESADSEGKE
jgi:hypothetical protein